MVATCPGLGCSNRLSRPSSPAARKGRHFAPSKSFRMKLPSLKLPFGSRKPPCAAAAGAPPAELEDAQGAVPPAPPLIQSGAAKTHLVVLVNGLFGSPANWTVIAGLLNQHLDQDSVLIHISAANQYRETFEGIDVCGRRLAEEIRTVIATSPSLRRISIIGHSMGGLISRYAIGELYDAETGTLAGLKPSHYVSLATPHCGCVAGPGEAQVPLFAWMDAVPAVGGMLSRTVTALSRPYVSIVLGRTGKQFFLLDRDGGGPPFMYRLACDWPGEGLLFLTALSRFETRTVYANRSGDHLVGWANSSLRRLSELPDDDRKSGRGKGGRGVVREDPLEWAWAPAARAALRNTEAGQRLDPGHGHTVSVGAVMEAETAEELVESTAAESQTTWKSTTSAGTGNLEGGNSDVTIQARAVLPPSLDPASASAAEFVDAALTALQGLPWRRVDCCFAGGALPLLAHQHLQVQRKYVNWEGMATARHLAMQVAAMEELVLEEAGVPVPVKNGVNASV